MIRPNNINIEEHTADFRCDKHGGAVEALDLNTGTSYTKDNEGIMVLGTVLTESCECATCFPVANGNEDAQAIAAAKTA